MLPIMLDAPHLSFVYQMDYVEEPMKYQALRPNFSLWVGGGWWNGWWWGGWGW